MGESKTNVMRVLDRLGIPYTPHHYEVSDGQIDGLSVAHKVGADPDRVFKTLVTRAPSGAVHVFVLPVSSQLDRGLAAKAAGEKAVEMLAVAELLPVTGYVRGGCSPIGMKKPYPVIVEETAQLWDTITISAGKIGTQVELSPEGLQKATGCEFCPIIRL